MGPEGPVGQCTQGLKSAGLSREALASHTCVQQICILGYLAKDSVARTQGAGQEELHLSDSPLGL